MLTQSRHTCPWGERTCENAFEDNRLSLNGNEGNTLMVKSIKLYHAKLLLLLPLILHKKNDLVQVGNST